MAQQSGVTLILEAAAVPALPGALEAAAAGVRTSAHRRAVAVATPASVAQMALLQDPQTSGGLLVAVHADAVPALLQAGYARVGRVSAGPAQVRVD